MEYGRCGKFAHQGTRVAQRSPQVEERPGGDQVYLSRKFGSEDIRISFSSEIDPEDDDDEQLLDDEEGLEDEDIEDPKEEARQEKDEDLENYDEEDDDIKFNVHPIRLAIVISKAGKGALSIDALARSPELRIDRVAFYSNDRMALDEGVEADWNKGALYPGPVFSDLDEKLVQTVTEYLDERGINDELAPVIIDLVTWKEQKEYVGWLKAVEQFVKA